MVEGDVTGRVIGMSILPLLLLDHDTTLTLAPRPFQWPVRQAFEHDGIVDGSGLD